MKKNTKNRKLTVTVAIPTCYGGESLYYTAKSIIGSKGVGTFRFILVSDRNPIKPDLKKRLRALGVELYWNPVEGSQPKKLKQMLDMTTSDLFIFTQDDIDFDPNALQIMVRRFRDDPKLTLLGVAVLPHPKTKSWVGKGMTSLIRMIFNISKQWNKGDNYLAASGRCMAFRTSHFKKYRIPEKMVNTDMFFYLENKRLNGTFAFEPESKVFIHAPARLKDQLGPSSRFQIQQRELKKYFDFDFSGEYRIPRPLLFRVLVTEMLTHPYSFLSYLCVFIYTRVKRQSEQLASNPNWAVDDSTKAVIS